MKFKFFDLILCSTSLLFVLSVSFVFTYVFFEFFVFSDEFSGILKILIYYLSMIVFTGLYMKAVRVIVPLRAGVFNPTIDMNMYAWKLQGFFYVLNLGLIINTYIVPINLRLFVYRFLGAKIGKNAMIGGKILDPPLVEIGDFTMLGEDTVITAHTVEDGHVTLGKIKIGNHVTIGVKAVVLPGVEIGDHALIAAGAVVSKNTEIGSWEIWGGVPAKKIGERKKGNPY